MKVAHSLDPYVLARIQGLTLRAKLVAEGVLSGLHRSRQHGSSVEFVEHKEYSPGDDLRYIDWRAYARRDKYSIKRYEEDTNIRGYLVIDQSASMAYQGRKSEGSVSKFDYAELLLASLAYLMLHQRDAVSLAGLGEDVQHFVPPRADWEHFHAVLEVLAQMKPAGAGDLSRTLQKLGGKFSRRGLVILFSDFLGEAGNLGGLFRALRSLRHQRHDVAVFHVLDRNEVDFPFSEPTRFEDMESELKLLVDPGALRKHYLEEMRKFLQEIRGSCLSESIDYHLTVTDEPADRVLVRFLQRRESM